MTIKEIAKLADVSIATVSRIINNKADNISPETKQRVLRIVKEYNYSPYSKIKNTSTTKTFILGVLLRNAAETNRLLNGIMEAAEKQGYSILLFDSHESREAELKHITSLCRNHADGVIWEPVSPESTMQAHYFEQAAIPVNYINLPGDSASYFIDFAEIGYQLTRELIRRGHTALACLLKNNRGRAAAALDGFKRCLFEAQIPFRDEMVICGEDQDFLSRLRLQHATGIVSSHYALSLSLYEQLSRLHLSVPGDYSLVSMQDDVREITSYPRISCIRIPYQEFGAFVGRELIEKCEAPETMGGPRPYRFLVPPELTYEDSIGRPALLSNTKIVVVGSINMDVILKSREHPAPGKTTTIQSCSSLPGGKGANQAIGVSRLGGAAALLAAIGDDFEANLIYDTLQKERVITDGVKRIREVETGKAYIMIPQNAESTISVLSGANEHLTPALIEEHSHVFKDCSFCLISPEIKLDTVITAAKKARDSGAKTILKPATLTHIPPKLYTYLDYFVPNRLEASILCPGETSPEKQAAYFRKQGMENVIITLGHKGCYLDCPEKTGWFKAAPVVSIDSTGGADAFISALAVYLNEGYAITQAIKIATYAAGFCVARHGVTSALIDRHSLESHIKALEPELLKK